MNLEGIAGKTESFSCELREYLSSYMKSYQTIEELLIVHNR